MQELAAYGARPALLTSDGALTYAELARRVQTTADALGPVRRLVLLASGATVESVVTYLAALTAGHPVLLTTGADPLTVEAMTAAYDPDVVAVPAGGWTPQERREGSAHALHPELALLLSTSGSTGSPKLARLSHENVRGNAASIGEYLGIRGTDTAITSLPLHYCYGLSVLHSHVLRGAGVVLTDLSVVDAGFWQLFRTHRVTTFAGVPHTFDLLDTVGFADLALPSLRYVTQAGGRLAPERVVRLAQLGERRGWDLFVMYGQTEATARMAYLPPDLAATHPGAIGVPVPGGSLRLEPAPDCTEPGVGELVYAGPNVMLGYAEGPADLSLGRTVHELHTGDLARRASDGLFEVVGRLSRLVKILGLRVDLQRVEAGLEELGDTTVCVGSDDELVVVAEGEPELRRVQRHAAAMAGLPVHRVRALAVDALPRLATGKPDLVAIRALATPSEPPTLPPNAESPSGAATVRALYAELLDRPDVTDDDTFVRLGGDSLSYVEVSLRLEQLLGHLPDRWHLLTVRQLEDCRASRRRTWRRLETGIALRAAAILAIVGSHVELVAVLGGAHVLLGLAGHNVARFHLTSAPRRQRLRHLFASTARVAVPSMAWITATVLVVGDVGWLNAALLGTALGPDTWGPHWSYWFVEVVVHTLLLLTVLISVPLLDRTERRWPFAVALAVVGAGLLTRYDLLSVGGTDRIHTGPVIVWIFALGWAAAKTATCAQRWLVTALVVVTVAGFFDDWQRDATVIGGLLLLVWVPSVPCPAPLARVAGVLASSSLYVYLTHWQVYPHLEDDYPVAALLASLVVGVAYWLLCRHVASWLHLRWSRGVSARRSPMTSAPTGASVELRRPAPLRVPS